MPKVMLVGLALACSAQSPEKQIPKQQVYDLPLPRAAAPGEMLVARVTVGPLKPHQRIIVRTRSGEIAGTVSPFGAQARQNSGLYTIPIPDTAVKDGHVRLLLQVEQKDVPARAPTTEEVHSLELAYVPVTTYGRKE